MAGVVVWADLQASDIGHVLDELLRRDKLVGVRHEVEDDPDDDWLIRDSSMRGGGEDDGRVRPDILSVGETASPETNSHPGREGS